MIEIGHKRFSLMILYAIVLHYLWAVLLLADPSVAHVTGLSAIRYILPFPFAGFAMIAAATLALAGFYAHSRYVAAMLMIPQQFLLLTAAFGGVEAVIARHFPAAPAIGYSIEYMMAAQMPTILAAIGHTAAMLSIASHSYLGIVER